MSLGHNPFLLAAILVALLLFTIWVYRKTVPDVGRLKSALAALRFVVLALIAFLLFRPTLESVETIEHPPVLAVLVDASESLGVTGGVVGADSVEGIRRLIGSLPVAQIDGDVRFYSFGGETLPLLDESRFDSISWDQQRTNFSSALEFVREDLRDQNLGAVLLVSDGRHNTGRNPLFVAERYTAPVYTIVVGDTTVRRDVLIQSVVSNDIGYVGNEIPIRVTVRSDGYERSTVNVAVNVDGVVVDRESVTLAAEHGEGTVDLSFVPTEPGYKQIRLSVSRLDGESTYRNNSDVLSIRVLESRKRVVMFASAPNPDVSALTQIFTANPDLELRPVVQKSAGQYYSTVDPDSVSSFDLIVLAGYPGAISDQPMLRAIASAAENGTPVLFLALRNTNLSVVSANLSSILPSQPDAVRQDYFDVEFTPTVAGNQHVLMDGISVSPSDWRRLSPLTQNSSRWKNAPDAVVLAQSTVRGIDIEAPLLSALQRPGYRSLAFLASGFWKWRNGPEDTEDLSAVYPALIENAVQWLTAAEDDRPVRVAPNSSVFAESDRIRFSGQVYDASNAPVSDAAVTIEVRTPDGRRIPLNMESSGNGRYSLDSPPLTAGTYTYTASADRSGVDMGSDNGTFAVGELALEFRDTRADPVLMRQIAERSGGITLEQTRVGDLPSILASSESFVGKTETIARESELWRRLFFMGIILALLTLEWFLRKRSGLV